MAEKRDLDKTVTEITAEAKTAGFELFFAKRRREDYSAPFFQWDITKAGGWHGFLDIAKRRGVSCLVARVKTLTQSNVDAIRELVERELQPSSPDDGEAEDSVCDGGGVVVPAPDIAGAEKADDSYSKVDNYAVKPEDYNVREHADQRGPLCSSRAADGHDSAGGKDAKRGDAGNNAPASDNAEDLCESDAGETGKEAAKAVCNAICEELASHVGRVGRYEFLWMADGATFILTEVCDWYKILAELLSYVDDDDSSDDIRESSWRYSRDDAKRAAVRRFLSRYLAANELGIKRNNELVVRDGSTRRAIRSYRIGRGSRGGSGADLRKGSMQSGPLGVLEKCTKKELVRDLVQYAILQSGDDVGGKRIPGYLGRLFWQQKGIRNKNNLPDMWRRLVHDVEKVACDQLEALRIEKQKAMIPTLVVEYFQWCKENRVSKTATTTTRTFLEERRVNLTDGNKRLFLLRVREHVKRK